jgi:alpha-tubulin suppressor-like RCC1 family protein
LVAGGHAFNQINAGGGHTCARTTAAVGYCWGQNLNGQLGNGTTTRSLTPVAVN